jgi:hypothetical protein
MKINPDHHMPAPTWHKSSYSGGEGGNCLEVAEGTPTVIPVRDSKNPRGPKLAFRPEAWSAFLEAVKAP